MSGGHIPNAEPKSEPSRNHGIGPILFVLGSPRSGTTLVSRMLLNYFDYGLGPEGHWIVPFAHRLGSFGDLKDDPNARRLIESILAENMFKVVRERYPQTHGRPMDVTVDRVWEMIPERTYAGIVYAVLAALAGELRRTGVGNKNPGFTRHLHTLHTLFPTQAQYLCVVRDGRDVALSMMKQPWGQKSWYANARFWSENCEHVERFQSQIAADRLLIVKYENLLREPGDIVATLEHFLDKPLTDELRSQLVAEIKEGSRNKNYGKWRDRMSARQHRLFEAAAGCWLDRFGYERMTTSPHARAWDRAYYMSLEYARRSWGRLRAALGFPAIGRATPRDRPGGL